MTLWSTWLFVAIVGTAPPASAPTVAPSLFPHASLESFDTAQTPWGPGRRSAGEGFRSAAVLQDVGALRLSGDHWSLGFGAQLFARGELRDNADLQRSLQDFSIGLDQRARVSLRAAAFGRVGLVLELQDVRAWGAERATNVTEPLTGLHQGFVDVRATDWLDLRVGRQELCYGEERLLGCLDWGQSARAFDGVFARARSGFATVDVFGFSLARQQRLTETLPDGSIRRLSNTGSYLYGVYTRLRPFSALAADVYAIGLTEDETSLSNGQRRSNHTITLGMRAVGKIGWLSVTGEGALQTGRRERELILAGGFAGRGVVTLPIFGKPYLLFEMVGATGDGDTGDGVHRQFNQLFPTAHAHLGFIDYVAWSNVLDAHAAVGFKPLALHVWVDFHHLRFWDSRGAWLNAAGTQFVGAAAMRAGALMGNEVDVSFTVPITGNVAIATAFSLFFPGEGAAPVAGVGRGRDLSSWGFVYVRSQL